MKSLYSDNRLNLTLPCLFRKTRAPMSSGYLFIKYIVSS